MRGASVEGPAPPGPGPTRRSALPFCAMTSLRQQLTRNLLAATLVLLGGGLLAVYLFARAMVVEQFDAALRAKAFAVSTLTRVAAGGVSLAFNDRFLRGFDDDKARDFFQLWDAGGATIARSESLKKRADLPRRFGKPDKPERWNFTLPNGRPGRAIGFAFRPRGEGPEARDNGPEVRLVVASDREDLDERLWGLLGLSVGCAALLVLVTLWLIPRVLRRGLRPLDQLGEQAGAIHAGSLATRFHAGTLPAELQPIARRLNDLLARLEGSFERERRFSADLAHELRTPIAELRALAECALKWPDAREPAMDRETLAIARHMERLVAHLLALARGEQGHLALQIEPLAIDELVRDTWRGFAPRAEERGLAVHLALAPGTAAADRALLRSILVNLFDNAVDYTPTGGGIAIACARTAERVELTVSNTTVDLAADDVPRLFDRFWRKEAARSGGQHFGLGLPLARTFAGAIGWTLVARLEDGNRLVFTLGGAAVRATS